MALPIWTSTKHVDDVANEDAFLSKQKVFERLTNNSEVLSKQSPENIDLRKLFRATTAVTVGSDFITKILKTAIKVAASGRDLKLRHIVLEFDSTYLKVYAATTEKVYKFKYTLEEADQNQESFMLGIDASQAQVMLEFLTKAFDYKTVTLGARVDTTVKSAEALLVMANGNEFRDEGEGPPKAAIFKIPREVGDSPILTMGNDEIIDNAEVRYSSTISPLLKWAFSDKSPYGELVHEGGILFLQFTRKLTEEEEKEGVVPHTVRASLGSKVNSNTNLPPEGCPIAHVDCESIFEMLKATKNNIEIAVGFNDGISSTIRFRADDLEVYMSQAVPIVLPDFETYITKTKGKVVEEEDAVIATERAMKQNKIPKAEREAAIEEFKKNEEELEVDPIEQALNAIAIAKKEVEELGATPLPDPTPLELETLGEVMSEEEIHAAHSESMEYIVSEEDIHAAHSESMEYIVPGEEEVEIHRTVSIDTPHLIQEKTLNVLERIADSLEKIASTTRGERAVASIIAEEVPEGRTPLKTSMNIICEYLVQAPGSTITTAILRQTSPDVKHASLHLCTSRLNATNIIKRLRKGFYYVPEDIEQRIENFNNGIPNEEIIVDEEEND